MPEMLYGRGRSVGQPRHKEILSLAIAAIGGLARSFKKPCSDRAMPYARGCEYTTDCDRWHYRLFGIFDTFGSLHLLKGGRLHEVKYGLWCKDI